MKYWFDTEFIDFGNMINLVSIGIVAEDGRTYYAETTNDFDNACDWVKANVLNQLGPMNQRKSRLVIRDEIFHFTAQDDNPEFWAWYGAYDWVAMSQLFGRMLDVPRHWPHMTMDVKQLAVMLGNIAVPEQTSTKHHALNDAIWTKEVHDYLIQYAKQKQNNKSSI